MRSKRATPNLGGLAWLSFFIVLIASFGILSGADRGGSAASSGNRSVLARRRNGYGADKLRWDGNRNGRSCGGLRFHSDSCCICCSNLEPGIRSSLGSNLGSSSLEHGCSTRDSVCPPVCSGLVIRKKNSVLPPGEHLKP